MKIINKEKTNKEITSETVEYFIPCNKIYTGRLKNVFMNIYLWY